MTHTVFHEIARLLLGGAAVGLLITPLRQPVIVRFIAVGIDRSAYAASQIRFPAEPGVVLFLFLVGLKLDRRLVRTFDPAGLGKAAFTAGLR